MSWLATLLLGLAGLIPQVDGGETSRGWEPVVKNGAPAWRFRCTECGHFWLRTPGAREGELPFVPLSELRARFPEGPRRHIRTLWGDRDGPQATTLRQFDPAGTGSLSVSVRVLNLRTGAPLPGLVQLAQRGTPQNELWSYGDRLVGRALTDDQGIVKWEGLRPGWYQLASYEADDRTPHALAFHVSRDTREVTCLLDPPSPMDVRLHFRSVNGDLLPYIQADWTVQGSRSHSLWPPTGRALLPDGWIPRKARVATHDCPHFEQSSCQHHRLPMTPGLSPRVRRQTGEGFSVAGANTPTSATRAELFLRVRSLEPDSTANRVHVAVYGMPLLHAGDVTAILPTAAECRGFLERVGLPAGNDEAIADASPRRGIYLNLMLTLASTPEESWKAAVIELHAAGPYHERVIWRPGTSQWAKQSLSRPGAPEWRWVPAVR